MTGSANTPSHRAWQRLFVERERFAGVCYRAANWLRVGQTCGRSRHDRDHTLQVPLKDIYLYGLCQDFKERLCG